MNIRKANIEDIPHIVQFQVAMAYETEGLKLDPDITNKGVGYIFENPCHGFYLLCEAENHIVGSLLVLYEWSDWRNQNFIWIHSVYIIPDWRKKGIFGKMYEYIKTWAENNPQIGGIRLYVDKTNTNAQKVYEKIGMNSDHYILYEWMKS